MTVCPFADQSKRYDRKYPGGYVGGTWRIVLHTTETTGLPSYSSGAVAPHFTVDPRSGRIWQHFDMARPSRALEHRPGTIDTNNMRAIQIEIVAYSDKALAARTKGLHVSSFTAQHVAVIAKLLRWIEAQLSVPAVAAYRTKPYPSSYGEGNGVRIGDAAWRTLRGYCQHQNVPHNNHGDAGALPMSALLAGADSMDLTPQNLTDIADAVLNRVVEDPNTGARARFVTWAINADLFAQKAFNAASKSVDPAAIAAAVVAALPPGTGGDLTPEQITQATEAGVRNVLGGLDNTTGV